jgi:Tfp pilus assembly protein PilF
VQTEVAPDIKKYRAITYLESGRQKFNAGNYAGALEMFDRAIEADEEFLRPYTAKATCLIFLKRIAEAEEICDAVIKRDPKYGLAYTAKAVILHRLGETAKADDAYRSGITLGPDEPTAFYNYACFCAQTGREEECRENLRKAISLDRTYNSIAATDEDLAAYRNTDWFEELVSCKKAATKRRGRGRL